MSNNTNTQFLSTFSKYLKKQAIFATMILYVCIYIYSYALISIQVNNLYMLNKETLKILTIKKNRNIMLWLYII